MREFFRSYTEWGAEQRYTSGRHSGLRWSENPWIQDRKPGWWAVRVTLGDGVLELTVEEAAEYLPFPDVRQFTKSDRQSILAAFQPLLDRPIGSVFQEAKREDRQALDRAILEALDLDADEYLPRVYEGLTTLVRERIELGRMRNRRRKERVKRDIATLEQQVLAEVLPKGPKRFPTAFFSPQIRQGEFETFALPHEPLHMERSPLGFGKYQLLTEGGTVVYEGNKFQADYVRYTQMASQFIVQMPKQLHHVSKVLAEYRQYLRDLRQRLYQAIFNRALDQAVAEQLTEKVWRELGLPEVEGT